MLALVATALLLATGVGEWPIHDRSRPAPAAVDPGRPGSEERAGRAPSDAIVLFDGGDLSRWRSQKDGGPARWTVRGGYFEVAKGTGGIETVQGFGDCQLHVEWATPSPAVGQDQDRGNSGVFLMGRYEVQVLDSYRSATYPDGQAGAIYGQYPPLVNPTRPPGQWQAYDVVFHAPRFDAGGALTRPARMTVLLNGVLIQDDVELTGPTAHKARPPYAAHPDKLPLALQDHDHPVRFRNVWVRELGEASVAPGPSASADGWTPLFNGKDLSGWKHVGPGEMTVEDGQIRTNGGMGLLYWTGGKLGRCVLRVVFRMRDLNDNSGVYIRIPVEPREPWMPVHYGYEVQIDGEPEKSGEDDHHVTGALYSIARAASRPGKPGPEWNTFEIALDGPRTTVVLNGVTVTDYTEGQPVPERRFDFEPQRGPRPDEGYVGIQNHGPDDVVFFREIAVRPLHR